MTISTLDAAVSILEKWLIANAPPKAVYLHFSPKELQEELGFSPSTFWYAMYKLREENRVNFYEPWLFSVFSHTLTNNKKENS